MNDVFKYRFHFERVVFMRVKPNKYSDLNLGLGGLNEIIYAFYLTKRYLSEQRRCQGRFSVHWYQKQN